jgi:hypothetical protein
MSDAFKSASFVSLGIASLLSVGGWVQPVAWDKVCLGAVILGCQHIP